MGVDCRGNGSSSGLHGLHRRVDVSVNDASLCPETLRLGEQAALLVDQRRAGIHGVSRGLAVAGGAVHVCRTGPERQPGQGPLADSVAGDKLRNSRHVQDQ